jgi:hypothetical protein
VKAKAKKVLTPVTEPHLELLDGKAYVWTAKAAYKTRHGTLSEDIGMSCGSPRSLWVICTEYPRSFVKRIEVIGGAVNSRMYNKTVYVPYTASGREIVRELIQSGRFVVRGLSLEGGNFEQNPNRFGTGKWLAKGPPVGIAIRVGAAEYGDHDQLKNELPDMPDDLNLLPVTLEAVEDLYKLVVTVCVREGLLRRAPETDVDRNLFRAETLRFEAERVEVQRDAMLLELDAVRARMLALTHSAIAKREEADRLVAQVEDTEPLPQE